MRTRSKGSKETTTTSSIRRTTIIGAITPISISGSGRENTTLLGVVDGAIVWSMSSKELVRHD